MKLEGGSEGSAAETHALGRADVEELDALAAIESPGELVGRYRRRVGHA